LEYDPEGTYHHPMDDNSLTKQPPSGWLEALARSEAQVAAGQIVSGEAIMRELDESIARLESKRADDRKRGIVSRR
jgi:hypothetical protein